jgi:hypothetical protein
VWRNNYKKNIRLPCAALDKFPAFNLNDLEQNFNLLGECRLRGENFRLRIVSLFPPGFMNFRHSVSTCRRTSTAFFLYVVFSHKRNNLRDLFSFVRRIGVGGLVNQSEDLILTLDNIKALPRTKMTTELKCIEGWRVVVNWTGAKFSDFITKYQPKTRDGNAPYTANHTENLLPYVSLVTPDDNYYVGFDMPSILKLCSPTR